MRKWKPLVFSGLVMSVASSPAKGSMNVWLDFGPNFQSLVDSMNATLGQPDFTPAQFTTMESNIQQQMSTLYSGYQINFSMTNSSGARPIYFDSSGGTLFGSTPAAADLGNSNVSPSKNYCNIYPDNFGTVIQDYTSDQATYLADYTRMLTNVAGHELGHSFGLLHQDSYGVVTITPANYANTLDPTSFPGGFPYQGHGYEALDVISDLRSGKANAQEVSPLTSINPWDRAIFDVSGGALEGGLSIVNNPVQEVSANAGHTLAAATSLTFSPGESSGLQLAFRRATLDSSGTDFYKFTTAGAGLFSTELRSGSGVAGFVYNKAFSPKVTLIGSDGVTPIWSNSNASYGGATFESPYSGYETVSGLDPFLNNIPIPSAGTYYLEVSAVGGFSAGNIYQMLSGFNAGVINPDTYLYQHAGGGDADSSSDGYQAWNNLSGGGQANFPANDGAAFVVIGSGGITNTGISSSNVVFNHSYTTGIDQLEIDSGNTLTQSSSSSAMITNKETLGIYGAGTYTQSAGSNTVNAILSLGNSPSATGTYNLSGSAQLICNVTEYIGYQGTGIFNQTGGTNAPLNLVIAGNNGSSGTYNLQNGTLQPFVVTLNTGGTFHQSGGSLTIATFNQAGGTANFDTGLNLNAGVYSLSGGSLTAANITNSGNPASLQWTGGSLNLSNQPFDISDVSDPDFGGFVYGNSLTLNNGMSLTQGNSWEYLFGSGSSITQNAGSSNTMPYLYMGNGNSGQPDNYFLNGGTLNIAEAWVGWVNAYPGIGAGIITQTGGTALIGALDLGTSGAGSYLLSGSGSLQVSNTINVGGSSLGNLSVSGGTATAGSLFVNSKGTVNVTGGSLTANSIASSGAITQSGGTSNLGAMNGSGQVTVGGGASSTTMTVSRFAAGSITVNDNGRFSVMPNSNFDNSVSALSFQGTGQLDLTNNQMFINYGSASEPDPIATIVGKIIDGYNSGAWNGTGIFSSTAQTDPGHGIGYADDGSTVMLKYTIYGDANLDGTVNFSDLLALAGNYTTTTGDWAEGDFNYDGTVNFSDLLLLAGDYTQTLSLNPSQEISSSFAADWALAQAEVAAVPEPTTLGFLAAGAAGLLARRRRVGVSEG